MKYMQGNFEIIQDVRLSENIYDFVFRAEELVLLSSPGQFLHILCGDKILRRPISICEIDKAGQTLRIVFEIKGEGTRWLSRRKAGEFLDILGPLGNGFPIPDSSKKAVLVGGGIGVPPLLAVSPVFGGKVDAILGFRTAALAILLDDFKRKCRDVQISTDDGSLDHHGFVTDLLRVYLSENLCDAVYTCGPKIMMQKVSEIALEFGVDCYVSLEERMACGIGACLGCACKIRTDSGEKYKHVCKDGPVFNAKEVVW